ncbi:MAG TPA: methyltransferase domain-containing protein [Thermoanaerobaculia bacterium]|nr:methyltransferase domain-containing protein [Thermoanaerobaculia bacterium]
MGQLAKDDYVLGTDEAELARLGLQHRVWRPRVLTAWERAGISVGSKVVDFGAGPGYATLDLAEIVGPGGRVVGVERSGSFVAAARAACERRGFEHVEIVQADLMQDEELPLSGFDFAWCRWVASFVSSPERLVSAMARSLRPGGVAVFHEYANYASWRLAPPRPHFEEFVAEVMASWRASGGEPDVALVLPSLLAEAGFTLREARPLVFVTRPGDFLWQWPAAFIDVNLGRLVDLGRITADLAAAVREEITAAERDPATLMTTPIVLELIAVKGDPTDPPSHPSLR